MYIVHVWPPLLSAVVHAILVVLYAVSIRYQAGSDMSDPQHPQHGAPWYITKSCSVVPANDQTDRGYCKQAKGAFACTCIMLSVTIILNFQQEQSTNFSTGEYSSSNSSSQSTPASHPRSTDANSTKSERRSASVSPTKKQILTTTNGQRRHLT